MIQFRCWRCHRQHSRPETQVGQVLVCGGCKENLRVPPKSGGSSRYRTPLQWCFEFVIYGLGGGFLGMCLAFLIVAKFRFLMITERAWITLLFFTMVGFVAGGLLGGGLDWIGRMIRKREQD